MNRHLADLEILAEPDRNPAGMHPTVLPAWDVGPDDVAGPKSLLKLLPRGVADREAILVDPAALILYKQGLRPCDPMSFERSGVQFPENGLGSSSREV
jgi:hypothetical protein